MTLNAVVGKVERVADGENLLENLGLIKLDTWQTSQEIFADWQNGAPVERVYTANLAVYRLVNGEPVFDLLGREGNPLVDERFREDAYHGILENEFFFPSGEMKEHILAAIKTSASGPVHYSGPRLSTRNHEPYYGLVDNRGGENTDEENKLFVAVYGIEDPGYGMRVNLLREDIVKWQLNGRKKDDMIAQTSYLSINQDFGAGTKFICYSVSAVRGVRRGNVAKGDAQN